MDSAQVDVILETVLPRYGINVRGIMPLNPQTVLVDSDRGVKRLRIDTDERVVKRRHALWEHLAKNGFRRIPRHIRSLYGESWVEAADQLFTLSDDWEGRTPEVMPLDMRLVGRNLAHLHDACRGLQLPPELALPKRHGTWLQRFTQAGEELAERSQQWSEHRQKNMLQERFLEHYEWISEQISRAVEGLTAAKYEEAARRAEQEAEFAVGDYRLSDLRISMEGRVATLHIDDAIADLPLYDVAKFAHGLIEKGEYDMARLFVDSYAETGQLSEQDIVVLDAYMAFPHAAYRHISQYARFKKSADVFAERLEQAVIQGQTRRPILYGADSITWS
ncbi:hypothetical protein [Tumebacillus flagellatus]|uniref:Aminoglycoside phosphotransferase domain-containing protein n=1 Tax=Tumebacillus flagellatus TaxID=1157490 RepID=A0A074M9U2_9BACL|nr:hypothetical protein [Tumebacillus flagellatus]KEO82722.1 hypothetical protein EL26_14245 [Tumebacillus flagellatus]